MDMQKMFSLEGKTALVTGGAYGIGFAIAEALAGAGAKIAFNCRSQSNLDKALADYSAKGIDARGYIADVTSEGQVTELIGKIEADLGGVDILVNNAGISRDGLLMTAKEEDFTKTLDINLKGAYFCTRAAAKVMLRQKYGRIVCLSSVVGLRGNPGQTAYAASKAGVLGLVKAAAKELAGRDITVNAVAPGFIETDMTAALPEKARQAMLTTIPKGRPGSSEDVARAVAFFAGTECGYITGQVLCVDGGMAV